MTRPQVPMTSQKNADLFDTRADREWLNPIAMSMLQRAVKNKAETVVLNDIPFTIEYGIMWKSKLIGDYECVCLRRADKPMPCVPFGYISVKKILDFKFEDKEK